MFFSKEQIMKEVQRIISDDYDNDIILIAANKGVGKKKLLKEIYGSTVYNSGLIVSNGEINTSACSLRRCFAEGIIEYISRNNNIENRNRLKRRINVSATAAMRLVASRKLQKEKLYIALCEYSLSELKDIYIDLAKDLPLVLISSSMDLTYEEVEYLKSLKNDLSERTGGRITFVIGVRATPSNNRHIKEIVSSRERGIWLLPLMASVEINAAKNDVYSMSKITTENKSGSSAIINEGLLIDLMDLETYNVIRDFVDRVLDPQKIYIMAKQEISMKSYDYLLNIYVELYKMQPSQFNDGLVVQYNNKLLWIDILTYYYALFKKLDDAIIGTQNFFFIFINKIRQSSKEPGEDRFKKLNMDYFLSFIHEVVYNNWNIVADGFADYYTDFAKLAKNIFLYYVYNYRDYKENLAAINVLERVTFDITLDSLNAIQVIYDSTQICSVLDIGLDMLSENVNLVNIKANYSVELRTSIDAFLKLCIAEVHRWNDITLLDKLICFLEKYSSHNPITLSIIEWYKKDSDQIMKEIIRELIRDKVSKGVIMMNRAEQNMHEFWYSMGKKIIEEYKEKCYMPIGKALPSEGLNEKLSRCEFIIITANSVENAIITRDLMESCNIKLPEKITEDNQLYQFFTLQNHNITHIVPQRTSSFSENGSADAVRSVLDRIDMSNSKLKAIFSIGVAYGVNPNVFNENKDQNIGDVLVSNRLIRWDAYIKIKNGEIQYNERDIVFVAEKILAGCKEYLQRKNMPRSKEIDIGQFNWHLGTLLCGNAVIDDVFFKNALLNAFKLYGNTDEIVGGEMEGSGIWFACKNTNVPIMIIKGICDWAENKNGWDVVEQKGLSNDLIKDCIQAYATHNAYKTLEFIINQVFGN